MKKKIKIHVVISGNEYDNNPLQTIELHGGFTTWKEANEESDRIQKKLDKSSHSLGFHTWVEELTVVIESD